MQINLIFTGKVLRTLILVLNVKMKIGNGLSYMLFPCVVFFSKSVGNNCPSRIRMFSFQYITFPCTGGRAPSDAIIKRAAKAKINWLFIVQDNRKYSSAFICTWKNLSL